jgi:biotin-dependent carboxylase-like uncharacterized protein
MNLEITALGSGLTLQDVGRIGWRRFGVPPGGAMDHYAMRAANQLLDNRPDAPVLEILLQGAQIKVTEGGWVALAGADSCAGYSAWTAFEVQAGQILQFTKKAKGLFAYLAVSGGFVSERWFGSVSVDPRNGLGRALNKGDMLCAKSEYSPEGVKRRVLIPEACRSYTEMDKFSLLPGPQYDVFSAAARKTLVDAAWEVSKQSDRTGYRLLGPELKVPESIPSEPVLPGSFQVPGNGLPIITMVDGPTVGGYPKIAILRDTDRDRLAQCAPGTQLRFQWANSS